MKRTKILTVCVLALALTTAASAQVTDWLGTVDTDWYNPVNWGAGVPAGAYSAYINAGNNTANKDVVADLAGGNASFSGLVIDNDSNLTILDPTATGNTFVSGGVRLGDTAGTSNTLTIDQGASVDFNGVVTLGQNGQGTMNVLSGIVELTYINMGFNTGSSGSFQLTGGTVNYTNTYPFALKDGWDILWSGGSLLGPATGNISCSYPGSLSVIGSDGGAFQLRRLVMQTGSLGSDFNFTLDAGGISAISIAERLIFNTGEIDFSFLGSPYALGFSVGDMFPLFDITSYNSGDISRVVGKTGVFPDGSEWVLVGDDVNKQLSVELTSVVPEPATLSLLAIGGLLAIRRRRA